MQAADLEKDSNSFTVCVAIGMFVLGVWGATLPSFVFSGTGLFRSEVARLALHNVFAMAVVYDMTLWKLHDCHWTAGSRSQSGDAVFDYHGIQSVNFVDSVT